MEMEEREEEEENEEEFEGKKEKDKLRRMGEGSNIQSFENNKLLVNYLCLEKLFISKAH